MNKKWIIIDPKGNVLPIEMNQSIWKELMNSSSFINTDIIKYTNKYNRELSGECIILDVSTFNQKNGDEKK